ncbi:uncharacterized protein LOC135499474 [Lineus longissimus]|uniref:uncharacterized protein LOC135499474 n=1 Tax=Lineus longissimus TaxID=88925 RepID=UPI002B4C5582
MRKSNEETFCVSPHGPRNGYMERTVCTRLLSLLLVTSGVSFSNATPTTKQRVITTTCEFGRGRGTRHLFPELDSSGLITSPNWPGTYLPKTAACRVALTTCQNCYIDFGFESLDLPDCDGELFSNYTALELEKRCGEKQGCDYILMKDGNKSADVFTGSLTGHVYVPMSNNVELQFCSTKTKSESARQWRISYVIRETGIPKSCYYSVELRHTCADGKCTDSLEDCAMEISLYPPTHPSPPAIPDHALIGIVGFLVFVILVVILGLTCNQSIRVAVKYLKYKLQKESDHSIKADSETSFEDSDVESDCSEDINSQGRDTLRPVARADLPHVGVKCKECFHCDFLSPWEHY